MLRSHGVITFKRVGSCPVVDTLDPSSSYPSHGRVIATATRQASTQLLGSQEATLDRLGQGVRQGRRTFVKLTLNGASSGEVRTGDDLTLQVSTKVSREVSLGIVDNLVGSIELSRGTDRGRDESAVANSHSKNSDEDEG